MLELFSSGLLSLWLDQAEVSQLPIPVNLAALEQAPFELMSGTEDKQSQAAFQRYLDTLSANGLESDRQGIWLQSNHQRLFEHLGKTPRPAASLTKVATSLVALKQWGPNHQFETRVEARGIVQGSILLGDLLIRGGGDPLFVWEEAIELGNALNALGIRQVTGNLVISDNFAMNFQSDRQFAGEMLKQGLQVRNWSPELINYYNALPVRPPQPQVDIFGTVQVVSEPLPSQRLLLQHRSLPVVQILKQMNVYSNNEISQTLADMLGNGAPIGQRAAWAAAVPATEIQLINGSGLGEENRISPRATCAMFNAIQRTLQSWRSSSGNPYTIADVFPISGFDQGTLEDRQIPTSAVVKTGTLNTVSALAGDLPTRDRGVLCFAIINGGSDITWLRQQQDQTLQDLSKQWGVPLSLPTALKPGLVTPTPITKGDVEKLPALPNSAN
jgi:D-alanyl-D-alanine carboxypeptidase/D-alanyl-D-alanine-endopeptidase (penicillin-binding protein 4)